MMTVDRAWFDGLKKAEECFKEGGIKNLNTFFDIFKKNIIPSNKFSIAYLSGVEDYIEIMSINKELGK